jgi:PAS domain S-box-containing protein
MSSPSTRTASTTLRLGRKFGSQIKELDALSGANEEQLRAVFNAPTVGVAVLTPEARFLHANNEFCSITGYPATELLALDYFAFLTRDDRLRAREQLARLLSGEAETLVLEQRYCRKNGETIWVQNCLSLTREAENRPASISCFRKT